MKRSTLRKVDHRRVGRYLICGEMASGGMASVHLGRLLGPVGFSKIVAIKRLHEQFASDPEFLSMFIDEARLASAISHPNVVSSLDVVVEHDELLLVMEYVRGETLAQLSKLARKSGTPATPGIILRIVRDALDGLHAAHTAKVGGEPLNIVHRDVSPQNIMVGVNGIARVLDFGIAKARSRSQITRPGRVMGKTSYLSPEQLSGQPLDLRTDVFSAGVVLWESLTHCRLFHAGDVNKTIERLLTAPIPTPSSKNPAVSHELDGIVMKALQRDRTLRYGSAAEFANALREVPGEATRAEVSAWVQNTASAVLAQRLNAVEELEAMDATILADVEPSRLSLRAKVSVAVPANAPPARAPGSMDTESTVASFTSSGTTRALLPKLRSPRRLRIIGGLSIALASGLIAIVLNFTSARHVATPLTSVRAPASIATSLAAEVPVESPAASARGDSGQVFVPKLQANERDPAALSLVPPPNPLPRKTLASTKHRALDKPAHRAAPGENCSLPYLIDASGVRRVRFECL